MIRYYQWFRSKVLPEEKSFFKRSTFLSTKRREVIFSVSLKSQEELILDENKIAEELNATVFYMAVFAVSPDSTLLAYSIDTTGSDQYTLMFKNMTRYILF